MQPADVLKQTAGDDRDTGHQFTVCPTIRNPIQAAPSLKNQIKFLYSKLKYVVLFVGRKQGIALAFVCKFHTN